MDRVSVAVGEPFVVVLPDNGVGGYLWHVEELPFALRIRREDDLGPGEGAPGATGEKAIELEATQPGTFTVRFERRRDWEPGADREQTLVVDVGDTSQPLRGGREGAM